MKSVYLDRLPDLIMVALHDAEIPVSFISRNHDGQMMIEIASVEDRLRAFKVLAHAIPSSSSWSRIHLSGVQHKVCLNAACGRKTP